jgi:phosphoglycolate phosphatase
VVTLGLADDPRGVAGVGRAVLAGAAGQQEHDRDPHAGIVRGMVREILFDLDGTLVDSLDDIAAALVRAMADRGLAAPARAQVREWIGGGARTLVERAVAKEHVEAVFERFRVHYAEAPVVDTRVFDGLGAVLDRMAGVVALAVVTNKPHELAVRIADRLLAPWPFAVVSGARPGVPLKPSPEMALAVAAELGVPPGACALVGDAGTDIAAAEAAGMMSVGVTWGYRPRAELASARLVVDTPAELAQLIAS